MLKDSAYCTLNQYFKMVAGNLRIMGLMPTDSGYYQCVGENSVGKVFGTAQLIIVDEGMQCKCLWAINAEVYLSVVQFNRKFWSSTAELMK